MANEHDFILRLVDPKLAPAKVGWEAIRTAMDKIISERSADSENVLRKVLAFGEEITLREGFDHPHVFTPREWLQAQALQALAAWGAEGATRGASEAIEAFADATESDTLERIARSYIGPLQAAAKSRARRRRVGKAPSARRRS